MFKQSRRKIVLSIMSILVFLWIGTLSVIYLSSYVEMRSQNEQMLRTHAQMYRLEDWNEKNWDNERKTPGTFGESEEIGRDKFQPWNEKPEIAQSPKFQLSTFYSVALSYDGEVLAVENEPQAEYTDADLEELAAEIVEKEQTSGTKKNLLFYAVDKGGYRLVAFMDNTIINESAGTLFRYTLLFGMAALVLFFFLSVYLARKIVQPLEESYEKQKQFISDAGHELKTPVSVVSTNAELLARELGENTWLSNIQYENERMGMLVTQLLELAHTEQVSSVMERIDFSRLCQGEILPFESVAYEKGLFLECDISGGITLEGDSAKLKQLVSILLDNGIRHSAGGNRVIVRLAREKHGVKLSVINSGDEIPAEQRAQLFERFYRVDTVRNGQDRHYGLGLAIAKSIVTVHKGRIDVLCYDGLVEFRVYLPLLQ